VQYRLDGIEHAPQDDDPAFAVNLTMTAAERRQASAGIPPAPMHLPGAFMMLTGRSLVTSRSVPEF